MATIECGCGRITGERCAWSGDKAETVLLEWMPDHIRASHVAAGNRGVYPANGAERLRVERSCAELIHRSDPEWTEILGA